MKTEQGQKPNTNSISKLSMTNRRIQQNIQTHTSTDTRQFQDYESIIKKKKGGGSKT